MPQTVPVLERKQFKTLSNISDWDEKIFRTAMYYAQCGYYVIPVRKNAKKLPGGKYPITYADASKRQEMVSAWFNPDNGRYKGLNIGIACGKSDGVFAVDMDLKENINGIENFEVIEAEEGEIPDGPTQVTPHGGRHKLLKWQQNAVNSTSKIGHGIDTRGGSADACKGHIVVWPSSVDGVRYRWLEFGEPPQAPQWLIDRLGDTWDTPDETPAQIFPGRGNENVTADDLENPVSVAQIKILLEHVDINDIGYDDWLRIGMAIKSEFPGDVGLTLWGMWSENGERYVSGECTIRWKGFSHPGSVRVGTLFHFARLGGWEFDAERDDPRKTSSFDQLIEDMNKQYAVVSVGGRLRILRQTTSRNSLQLAFDLLDKDTFKTLLENRIIYGENSQGVIKPITHAAIWLAHPERRDYVNGLGLFPEGAPEGYFNTWEGFSVEPQQGEPDSGGCNLFLDLVHDGLCNGDRQMSDWLLDWCADLIQHPEDPKGCCVVLKGLEGTGKGTFAKTLGYLLGPHFRHLIDDSYLTSNFNSHLMDAVLVFADEITWGGNIKSAGKLRGLITERNLLGERKGIDVMLYRNIVHVIIASNADWVVPAGQNSRRWFVQEVSASNASSLAYFNALHTQLEHGGYEALLHLLMNRDIKANLRFAPVTGALEEQRELSAVFPTTALWWASILDRGSFLSTPSEEDVTSTEQLRDHWPQYVKGHLLYDEYLAWCERRHAQELSHVIFMRSLRKWGMVASRPYLRGQRDRVISLPSISEAKKLLRTSCPGLLIEENLDD